MASLTLRLYTPTKPWLCFGHAVHETLSGELVASQINHWEQNETHCVLCFPDMQPPEA